MRAIDLFSGMGGFSLGAEQAGCSVEWAANHWPSAVDWYTRNHPSTRVQCQDLHLADWHSLPAYDVLLASPACQGHTWARGKDRPQHDTSRATAWAVVSAVEAGRPPLVVVENVDQMRTWPLYNVWKSALEALGYSITELMMGNPWPLSTPKV